ncbi:MAG: TylF/MycF/NovP-related O-methyltransferase [Patescibacteria group bacterium]
MNIPILLTAFTRYDTTKRTFDEIRKAKPEKLFFYVDGPRDSHPDDAALVEKVRSLIKEVDWECEVSTLFPEKNLGFIEGMGSALNWFFENVEEGIVLEDDCLPDSTFFPFVREMLDKYKNDERVMHISGDNFQFGQKRGEASYYFSAYPNSWGWATWKRAWKHFDPSMKDFPVFKTSKKIEQILPTQDEQKVWMDTFEKSYTGEFKTWDYVWVYTIFERGGLFIIPNVNLVSNIGFGAHGTHTVSSTSIFANIPTEPMMFPLTHPVEMRADREADRLVFNNLFKSKLRLKRMIKARTLKMTPRWMKDVGKMILAYPDTRQNKKLQQKYRDFTMIRSKVFIENLTLAGSFSSIKGAVVECGVWRGGMSAAMAEKLGVDREYHLFDSFEGLPPAKEIDGERAKAWQSDKTSKIYFDNCKAEMSFAQIAMEMSGATNVTLHKGWFSDTLPNFTPSFPIAVLRLDGDWYDSTMQCLDGLFKYVAKGGAIIIDDYYTWEGCSKAVHDFLSKNNLKETVHESKGGVAYIIKQ